MEGTIRWDKDEAMHFYLDGQEVTEGEFRRGIPDREGVPGGHLPACWPMTSEALACDPSQVGEMNERNRAAGIGARYTPAGDCVIGSRGDRKKLLKREGFHDNSGGYGD